MIPKIVKECGGLDSVVLNAGVFPASKKLTDWELEQFNKVLAVNLTGHWLGVKETAPLLENGFRPSIIIVGSKNVSAPGPGAGPYSISKAGITQMGRVLSLELAEKNIRVQTIHPDAVFDTGLWSDEMINQRAQSYGLTKEQYKTKNLLGVEINSSDVASIISLLISDQFLKTTGAQITIDGGNDRTILNWKDWKLN